MAGVTAEKNFTVVMIKPSHYDNDGYPITWRRTIVPSNTLAALYGIGLDAAKRKALGETITIHLEPHDETNRRIRPQRIIAGIRERGGKALVCLVGVQSNQFERAVDLAKPFLAAGIPVMLGGFHISGCLSMLKETPAEIKAAMALGISMFAGEAEEGRFDEVLQDACNGTIKPMYNYLKDLPKLNNEPTPLLPASEIKYNYGARSSFDLGRGCPFQCSFCTIINVQGRKSRFRTAEDLERIVLENHEQGIHQFFITDDNFARNREWEAFFDVLIRLRRKRKIKVKLIIQVDTQCHKIPRFIDKAAKAGVRRAFIGLENINPDNLVAAKKRQNKITDYRILLQKFRERGIFTWAGYILGFPGDSKQSILRDIEIIKRELPLDLLEMFFLTPLPGSEDHRTLLDKGVWMDSDLNKYNLHNRVSHHPKMSDKEWEEAYAAAWASYYSYDHIETVARRHAIGNSTRAVSKVVSYLMEFKAIYEIEKVHPLEGGVFRMKYRSDRRPSLPRELPGVFHLKLFAENAFKVARYINLTIRGFAIVRKVTRDPNRRSYTDTAISPVTAAELDQLEIFSETEGGEAAAERKRIIERHKKAAA
jgi:radical SAM superfamily enzyme YgiQ (UPF0313 family)